MQVNKSSFFSEHSVQCESKNLSPEVFLIFFPTAENF